MPFIQYVSGAGVLHSDNATFARIRKASVQHQPPASALRNTPSLCAVVLDARRPKAPTNNQTKNEMPPVIDLSLSDDEDITQRAKSRPAPAKATPASASSGFRFVPGPPKRNRDSLPQMPNATIDLTGDDDVVTPAKRTFGSSSASGPSSTISPMSMLRKNYKESTRAPKPNEQSTRSAKPLPPGFSRLPPVAKEGAKRASSPSPRNSETIAIGSDDEGLPDVSQFVGRRPKQTEPKLVKSSHPRRSPGMRDLPGLSDAASKRPRVLGDSASPDQQVPKRRRLDIRNGGSLSISSSDGSPQSNNVRRLTAADIPRSAPERSKVLSPHQKLSRSQATVERIARRSAHQSSPGREEPIDGDVAPSFAAESSQKTFQGFFEDTSFDATSGPSPQKCPQASQLDEPAIARTQNITNEKNNGQAHEKPTAHFAFSKESRLDANSSASNSAGSKAQEPAASSIDAEGTTQEECTGPNTSQKDSSAMREEMSAISPEAESIAQQQNPDCYIPNPPKKPSAFEKTADMELADPMQPGRDNAGKDVSEPVPVSEAPSGPLASIGTAGAAAPDLSSMTLAKRVEKTLGKYLEELRGDTEYWTKQKLKRSRRAQSLQKTNVDQVDEPTSIFAKMKPLPRTSVGGAVPEGMVSFTVERTMTGSTKRTKTSLAVPVTVMDTSDVKDVPGYSHHVGIRNNILAPNVTNLHCWPYHGDDHPGEKDKGLRERYKVDIPDRPRKLLRLLQADKYEEYVESALEDLGITWADVLTFLLDPSPNVGKDLDATKALKHRNKFCKEDFAKESDRWTAVLSTLPKADPEKSAAAAVLCDNFSTMAGISLWHLARRSDTAKKALQQAETKAVDLQELSCRVCLRFNCPYHGELKEDSESDAGYETDEAITNDIINPLNVNHRSRRVIPPSGATVLQEPDNLPVGGTTHRLRVADRDQFTDVGKREPFYPCHHPGKSCDEGKCSCVRLKITCEKTCGCSSQCPRKFRGCSCSVQKKRPGGLVCFEDDRCLCYQYGRECDPDLCGKCGVCDVLDPVHRQLDGMLKGRCANAGIQRGVPKHTLLGDSQVHGFGLYACENIKANEFVGEYKGEVVTKDEAERRGAIYENQGLSYLFSLNAKQEIDSTFMGNKMRFINHRHDQSANLYPRVVLVNTVHRIALYCKTPIKSGEELFFDYGPDFPDEQKGVRRSRKSAPHVRNMDLVKGFYDVKDDQDELGNKRARKGSKGCFTRSNDDKPAKKRGGARAGAGRPRMARKTAEDLRPEQDGRLEHAEDDLGEGASAWERLAAFNISDNQSADGMDVDARAGADDDDYFEPDGSDEDIESSDSDGAASGSDEEMSSRKPKIRWSNGIRRSGRRAF